MARTPANDIVLSPRTMSIPPTTQPDRPDATDRPTPRDVFETLLPHLRVAAAYSREIQRRIDVRPEKDNVPADNPFATALTDADLSIQTFVEVLLLGAFPQLRFHGEEHEQTYNTKYFRSIDLGEAGDYLLTLDPIDGTRFYKDGFESYQIILTAIDVDDYLGVLAISPALDRYFYALRGEGAFSGAIADDFNACKPLRVADLPRTNRLFFGWNTGGIEAGLRDRYETIAAHRNYSLTERMPTVNGLLMGEIDGVVLSKGKWIDGAALAFLAGEMGYVLSDLNGEPLERIDADTNYERSGILVAATAEIHADMVTAGRAAQS